MKKTIMFALLVLLFLALFTGCRAYRRTDVTVPGHYVTNTDGRTTQGFQYRSDGYPAGVRDHGYRHDSLVTGRDGVVGHGNTVTRPHTSGMTGMDRVTGSPYGSSARTIVPSATPRLSGTGAYNR